MESMNAFDGIVIGFYLLLVFYLAYRAKKFLHYYKSTFLVKEIEVHYLAAKSITYWECLFSICAASISAYHFLILPGLVFAKNMSYLPFILGIIVSRFISATYILPHLYNRGLTVIEAIAQGDSYFKLSRVGFVGRKMLSLLFFFFKVLDVALKLYLGSLLLCGFFGVSIIPVMMCLCLVTYLYTILGGLKAVVRTDILQFFLFLSAGIFVPLIISEQSGLSLWGLMEKAASGGKFSLLEGGKWWTFFLALFAGVLHDLCATSCDQEIVQKLLGTGRMNFAKRALKHSSVITILVNILFLFIGAILWSFAQVKGVDLPHTGQGAFYTYILTYIPGPIKGLLIAGSMAAVMSSLDSAINALSCIYWNDIMPSKSAKYLSLYIKLDMMIITQIILFAACLLSKYPNMTVMTDSISTWASAPLLALIIGRVSLTQFYKLEFNLPIVFATYGASFFGLIVAKIYLKADIHLTLIFSAFSSFIFLKLYSYLSHKLDLKFSQGEMSA